MLPLTNSAVEPLDLFEVDFQPSSPREEARPVQLENRGVTSQRSKAEQPQLEFWEKLSMFSETIVAKLDEAGRPDIADQIRDCHSTVTYRRCCGCSSLSKFYNRCDKLWCPLCTPRLGRERKKSVEWWCQEINQPKHVVLTARNSAALTKDTVHAFKDAFTRLRRSKFARNWRGGFYSLETTNEGRGWHLHLHALIDARYIDARELAVQWARCIGQDFAIVKVKDARDGAYLQEVTKYVVKGSDLAKWSGTDIACLVDAFTGVRTFGVFGSLYGKRTEFREWIQSLQLQSRACQCGCRNFRLLSENELLALDLTHDETRAMKLDIPPPHPELITIPPPSNYDCSC